MIFESYQEFIKLQINDSGFTGNACSHVTPLTRSFFFSSKNCIYCSPFEEEGCCSEQNFNIPSALNYPCFSFAVTNNFVSGLNLIGTRHWICQALTTFLWTMTSINLYHTIQCHKQMTIPLIAHIQEYKVNKIWNENIEVGNVICCENSCLEQWRIRRM